MVKIDAGEKGSDDDEEGELQQEPSLQDDIIEEGEEDGSELGTNTGSELETKGNSDE